MFVLICGDESFTPEEPRWENGLALEVDDVGGHWDAPYVIL